MKLNSRGIAHLFIILVVVVIGAIGVVGWRVMKANNSTVETVDRIEDNAALTDEEKIDNTSAALIKEVGVDSSTDSSVEDSFDQNIESDASEISTDDLSNVGDIKDEIN